MLNFGIFDICLPVMVRNTIDSKDCGLGGNTGLVLSSAGIVAVMIPGDAGDNQHTSSRACTPQLHHHDSLHCNVTYRSGQNTRAWVSLGSVE